MYPVTNMILDAIAVGIIGVIAMLLLYVGYNLEYFLSKEKGETK